VPLKEAVYREARDLDAREPVQYAAIRPVRSDSAGAGRGSY
jgi:hypothetical protein